MILRSRTYWYSAAETFFLRSWWVILFFIACFFFYEQGLIKREADFTRLQHQYQKLLKEKKEALSEQERLTLEINSQSDPEYVELTLMKGLGLAPEGSKTVVFTADSLNKNGS